MNELLTIATAKGLYLAQLGAAGWQTWRHTLVGVPLTAVIAREGFILAGGRDGIWRSGDYGDSWEAVNEGLAERHVRWLAYHPDISDFELAGTEPAGLFISHNGGDQWQARPEVAQLRDRHNWYLPYSPAAGAIRGLAVRGDHLYAAVEVGGLLRSVNRGASWQLAGGSSGQPGQRGTADQIDADIHDIVLAGQNPLHLLAATQTGLYESRDGGDSWRRLYGPAYCRAVWADPDRPDHLLLGPAYGVDRNGTIQHSQDGGQSWSDASHGLPTPWPRTMVERFYQVGSQLIAVLSDGNLLQSHIGVWQWRPLLPDIAQARAVWSLTLNP
ncbi:MAG: hypothetical protein H6651_20595 [Ardenticatenales bacterium]|nr:hypothetical protein [Ardenticatenales bacterium]